MKLFIKLMISCCLIAIGNTTSALTIKGKRLSAKGGSFFIEVYGESGKIFLNTVKLDQEGGFSLLIPTKQDQLYWVDGMPVYLFTDDEVDITLAPKKTGISTNAASAADGFIVLGKRSKENMLFITMATKWDMLVKQYQAGKTEVPLASIEQEYQRQKLSIPTLTTNLSLQKLALEMLQTRYLELSLASMRKKDVDKRYCNQLILNLKEYNLNAKAVNALRPVNFIAAIDAIYVLNQIKLGKDLDQIPTKNFSSTEKINFVVNQGKTARIINEEVVQSIVNHLSLQGLDEGMDELIAKARAHITNNEFLQNLDQIVAKYQNVTKNAVAPLFSLTDQNGEMVNLTNFKGKIVVIDVWGNLVRTL